MSHGAGEFQEASQDHVHRGLAHFREAEVREAARKHLAEESRGQVHTIIEALALPDRCLEDAMGNPKFGFNRFKPSTWGIFYQVGCVRKVGDYNKP